MKRYNVKPTDMGSIYWEEAAQGDWVRWEDVKYYLDLFTVIERLELSDRDFNKLKESLDEE